MERRLLANECFLRRLKVGVSAVLLTSLILSGCSQGNGNKLEGKQGDNGKGASEEIGSTYPLNTTETISSWEVLDSNAVTFHADLADTPFGKALAKATGVNVKYIHPNEQQSKEQFNLMIASDELLDTVEYDWTGHSAGSYPGGPEKAISDGVILELNDIIDQYAPNLKKKLAANKELDKMVKTDSGKYYVFPMIRNSSGLVFRGPMIRKDWLDDLKLPVPTTIAEWETTLKAFKDQKGAKAPLSVTYTGGNFEIRDAFIGAYHTSNSFYIDDEGKVKYGPIDPQYKDFLTLFRKWFAEGLFDKDFALTDTKALDNKILTGQTGATVHQLSGGIGRWMDAMKEQDPKFNLVGTPYPTLNNGEVPFTGQLSFIYNPGPSKAITTSAKNPELVARWLDYAYSDEGAMLLNFGIEGESYVMENGAPVYTDLIKNNEKYSLQQMVSIYSKPNGPYEADGRRNWNTLPQQDEAVKVWSQTDAKKHTLPAFLTPTAEESKELGKIVMEVSNYKEEMFVKFIVGKEPMESYDQYVAQIKKMGIDRAIEIYQSALERYNKR
ncbi:extracellular solute-binding protein [Paenibacillus macquariensis]|uniref:Aldouronate transport system substrate-binding protein n=1 Tax=Paenibacillus macquariensis TaxID=948756 RepID=A0ABY1JJA7_9BACL|nr:extracellular solute-binding protein [Paenibacillus macquariensis]MEC0089683.1 extracellular solute-binding protein [Paenibacillus macquariensis]OAB30837.1 ABC transporter substrate-binding protein [Paenibacillus macquariensis subsp. macquariensis]SIQ28705.1 putative aldouronate transport system substrate-binding protein [Paenibacillus macquariensis]